MTVLEAMKATPQWHLWRLEGGSKIPYQIDGIRKAKANDPETWEVYDDAINALVAIDDQDFRLAFTLGEKGLFVGIDFDDCFDNGVLYPWASEIYEVIKGQCYSEFSPSGTGFKAVMLGEKPEGSRCSKSMGDGKQAIEIYDHNRYWCFTGEVIDDYGTTENSDQMVGEILRLSGLGPEAPAASTSEIRFTETIASSMKPSNRGSRFSAEETAEYRAKAYLDKVDLGTSQRNNTLFRAAGSIRQIPNLPEDRVLHLARCLNNGFSKGPLSDSEVQKAVWSSGANGSARGHKGDNHEFIAESQSDPKSLALSEVLFDADYIQDVPERSEAAYRPSNPEDQLPMDRMMDDGFIGWAMKWIMGRQTESQPEMAFSAAIHMVGLGLSRNWKDDSPYETTGNLYSMILADSGSGKDIPRKMINKFLDAVGRGDMEGPSTIDSGAGLAAGLARSPSMSMLLDECGDLFSNLASDRCPAHFKKVGTVLKSVYTSATVKNVQLRALANSDAGQNDPVDFPHLHILATATPRQVLGTISDSQIEDGLMGRFLLFFGNNDPDEQVGKLEDVPSKMIGWFCDRTECSGPQDVLAVGAELRSGINAAELKVMPRSPEAAERLESHFIAINRTRRKHVRDGSSLPEQAIWSRASEKTAKLAMIFAASRGSYQIETEDANRAIAVNNHLTRRVVRVYKTRIKTEYQERRAEVLRTITTKFTSEAQIFRLNSSIDPQLRVKILNDLIDSQEIHEAQKGAKTYYVLGSATG